MSDKGRYLYAVCRDLPPDALDGVPALGAGHPEVVRHRDLVCVVSTVDLRDFGEAGLRANLERLAWVELVARRHDAVVRACAAAAPTAPLRLATICRDDDAVRERLATSYDALVGALDRVVGRGEWSVKVHAIPAPEHRELEPAEPAVLGGAAYLRRRKAAMETRLATDERCRAAAETVDHALREAAVAARRLRPQDPRLSGQSAPMLLNVAYLVDAAAEQAFAEAVAGMVAEHPELSIACDGPWPPYSFASLVDA